jgi:hypothetical protein
MSPTWLAVAREFFPCLYLLLLFFLFLFILDLWLLVAIISLDEAKGGGLEFTGEDGKGSTSIFVP